MSRWLFLGKDMKNCESCVFCGGGRSEVRVQYTIILNTSMYTKQLCSKYQHSLLILK